MRHPNSLSPGTPQQANSSGQSQNYAQHQEHRQQQQQQQQQQYYQYQLLQPRPQEPQHTFYSSSSRPAPHPWYSMASNGNSDKMTRADTEKPLSNEEYEALQRQLGNQGVQPNDSTFTRLLDDGAGPSTLSTSWMEQTNHFQNGAEVAAGTPAALQRNDTLERNPGFIDPVQMTEGARRDEQQPAAACAVGEKRPHQDQQLHEVKVEGGAAAAAVEVAAGPVVHNVVINGDNTVTITELGAAVGTEDWLNTASPTGFCPADKPFAGDIGFSMEIMKVSKNAKNKDWDYSADLRKLYIDIDKYVQIAFRLTDPNVAVDGLFIRALPVFALPGSLREVVKRCPNHASPSDALNRNFNKEFLNHLIRVNCDAAEYQTDPTSERLSVVVPFTRPQVGTDFCSHLFKFMCLGSDVGGINRRPLKVIFTLEDAQCNVFARDVVDVRICSCPKRDCGQEVKKWQEDRDKALGLATGLARSNSVFTKPSAKKRRLEVEEFVMVPVAKADFEKINEMAEAVVIIRNPAHTNQIKEQRKKLLEMHNKRYLNKPKQETKNN